MTSPKPDDTSAQKPGNEFVVLSALLMSLVALSIDSMLPALGAISQDLAVSSENDRQLVLIVLFFGLSIGQLIYGPLSDSIGRKRSMNIGLVVFIIGSILSAGASDFTHLLIGRFLQGLGAGGPRIVVVAMVRDIYDGRAMARVMSLVLSIFILVPVFAPIMGQGVLLFASWRAIFIVLFLLAVLAMAWLNLRQPETLALENRQPFTVNRLMHAIKTVLTNRLSFGYMLATGFLFASFVAFLASSQQIFSGIYDTGRTFPFYFAVLAASVGVASLVNARLVMQHGMRRLSGYAIIAAIAIAGFLLVVSLFVEGRPPLWLFMVSFMAMFFFIGILFGNLNALAMQEMGHIAGTAAAVIGSFATIISMSGGGLIGHLYAGNIIPVVGGFVGCLSLTFVCMLLTEGGWTKLVNPTDSYE